MNIISIHRRAWLGAEGPQLSENRIYQYSSDRHIFGQCGGLSEGLISYTSILMETYPPPPLLRDLRDAMRVPKRSGKGVYFSRTKV